MTIAQVVESLPDGGSMWQRKIDSQENDGYRRCEFACSWDSAMTIADDPKVPVPFVEQWFPNPMSARLAWEINKPARPVFKTRFGKSFTDPRGIFGSSNP